MTSTVAPATFTRYSGRLVAASLLIIAAVLFSNVFASTSEAAGLLGTAEEFAVLGGSAVTNTGATVVQRNLGVSPGSSVTGFPPGTVTGGSIHVTDAVASQAQSDVTSAYNALAGQACDVDLTGQDLGGKTLLPGTYCFSSSAQLTGDLTLDALGNSGSLFVFQIGSTLTTASGSSVLMVGGSACNVYWQIGSSATLGTTTRFQGSILALTSITLNNGTRIIGRALARNGAVTMDNNTVSASGCADAPAEPTATEVPATATSVPATATSVPATETPGPDTPTAIPGLPTEVPGPGTPTAIPGLPTATPGPGTPTAIPGVPTATPGPGTPTAIPGVPTATPGPGTPTAIPGVPTATPGPGTPSATTTVGPGTATSTPTGSGTPTVTTTATATAPATATSSVRSNTATPYATATATPITTVRFPDTGSGGPTQTSNVPFGSIALGIALVTLLTGGLGMVVERRRHS